MASPRTFGPRAPTSLWIVARRFKLRRAYLCIERRVKRTAFAGPCRANQPRRRRFTSYCIPAQHVKVHAHFIGINPAHRGAGLRARLSESFFRAVKARGCTLVHAVTSTVISLRSVPRGPRLRILASCIERGRNQRRKGVGKDTLSSRTGVSAGERGSY